MKQGCSLSMQDFLGSCIKSLIFFFLIPFPCVFLHEELGFQKQASSVEACPEQKLLLLHLSLFAWGWEEPLGSRWELESSFSPCCFSSKLLQSHHPLPPPSLLLRMKAGSGFVEGQLSRINFAGIVSQIPLPGCTSSLFCRGGGALQELYQRTS